MKILLIGLFTFLIWSTFSSYIYVCKIKGLCNEPGSMQISEIQNKNALVTDTLETPIAKIQLAIPKDLVLYFDFDKSDFKPNEITDNFFNESNTYLNHYTQASIKITGHTDAIGSIEYNQSLGFRRAKSAQQYFEKKGIQANKINIISKGENDPADNNNTIEGRAKNRRTVITIKK